LRGGFKKLDPRRIPPDKIEEAASLSRGDRWSVIRGRHRSDRRRRDARRSSAASAG